MVFIHFQQSGVCKSSTARTCSSISNLKKRKILKHSLSKPGLVRLPDLGPGLSNSLAELLEQLPWCHANPRTLWVWLQLLHCLSSDIWRLQGAGSILKSWFQPFGMFLACLRFRLGMRLNAMTWLELCSEAASFIVSTLPSFTIFDRWFWFHPLPAAVGSEIWRSPVGRWIASILTGFYTYQVANEVSSLSSSSLSLPTFSKII